MPLCIFSLEIRSVPSGPGFKTRACRVIPLPSSLRDSSPHWVPQTLLFSSTLSAMVPYRCSILKTSDFDDPAGRDGGRVQQNSIVSTSLRRKHHSSSALLSAIASIIL
ncbi:hypothetical protein AMAG_18925 [Allomyces macrogynus ATCC 38327]|uniref:Uncharacterized protein n=1 Tax=Allomyces macrogynus (strain ATCC 38327) TaxID=578462 RepID=A0A0L0SK25_ALLM3|nr:hypothetical protein AMAG_18925 [Allomyces macrogynus ATCC 38327]|eukprot:KNE62836.1 hypothetical protein AMAG_18925 [Allomyces macrogynus ATCC 38327]